MDKDGSGSADNRGNTPNGILSAVGANGTTNTHTGTTNASGIVEADFLVTMNPGDNFMVAASGNQAVVNGITASGITLKDSGNNTLPTTTAKNSLMVTVWRHLNLEVDNMGEVLDGSNSLIGTTGTAFHSGGNTVIPLGTTVDAGRFENGKMWIDVNDYSVVSNTTTTVTLSGTFSPSKLSNQFYVLYDDDDYDNDIVLNGDEDETSIVDMNAFVKMAPSDDPSYNVFAPVYIMPRYNGGAGNGLSYNGTAPFDVNVELNETLNQIQSSRGSSGKARDDFWISYIQVGYQPSIIEEGDPTIDLLLTDHTLGITAAVTADVINTNCNGVPQGGFGSLIFQETQRDWYASQHAGVNDNTTAPHELGHQFGLTGDDDNFGIMSDSFTYNNTTFIPSHLNIIRCRVKSPGIN